MSARYLVTGAADWELAPLIGALERPIEERLGIWTTWRSAETVILRTDWGPINAVAATLAAIDAFHPAAVICQGMAGAHNPDLAVGDIVVAERTVDIGAYKSDPAGGRRVALPHRFRLGGGGDFVAFDTFPCDPALVGRALAAPHPESGRVVCGVAGSAYQYNRELNCISALRKLYNTDCEDMESAFVASAALLRGVPFLAVRIVSNSEWTEPALDKSTGAVCARFVLGLI